MHANLTRTLARRLLLDRHAAFWLGQLDPTWSIRDIRARVVAVVVETPDTKTFVLAPNRRWRGHRAGQHTTVEVEIDGVRHRRCYSISSAPCDPRPAITVKRVAGGRVSPWLHDHVRPGHVLGLSPAAGDFGGGDLAAPLLLLGGGSGVTPLMSIVRDLDGRDAVRDVVVVVHARSRADVIFRRDLEAIAARRAGLRLVVHHDDDPRGDGRFDETRLARLVPDFAARTTLVCGPPGLMDRVEQMWALAGAAARLQRERFGAPPVAVPAAGAPVAIRLTASARSVAASGPGTLLEQLERAGERPASGCRIGICQTCKCRKHRGVVENLRTGAISSDPDEDIQLCISRARSDLELGL
jgi:stearoyl-CoA 9-desaturase NADPH oxidoreductase